MKMAEDRKRDFSVLVIIFIGVLLCAAVLVFWLAVHTAMHGPDRVDAAWVQLHDQDITAETRDAIVRAVLVSYGFETVCFDNTAGAFLVKVPKHEHEVNTYDEGWYLVDFYTFIQLENKSYIIKGFGTLVSIVPNLTGIYCRDKK